MGITAFFTRDSEKHDMKPAALLHALALAVLFATHFTFAHELSGVRRALQTIATAEAQLPAAGGPALIAQA